VAAAKAGAVGVLVRSVTTRSLRSPHTGATYYAEGVPKIPAAAVSTEDADRLTRELARGPVRVRLELASATGPDAPSANVVAEIPGATLPGEVVLIGAHIDSWDVGQGAHDDGAGVIEVMEAMRLLVAQGERPKRTIRAVLFTNEENGLRGGLGYAAAHGGEVHVAAIESDLGGGRPEAWSATGTPAQLALLREAAAPLGVPVEEGGGGADIGPLKEKGVMVVGLVPDHRAYFDVHHTEADTVDKVDPAAMAEATGALAALAWRLANH
jgi:carboxypeptidase Q